MNGREVRFTLRTPVTANHQAECPPSAGIYQGVIYPEGSDEAYFHTGKRDAVMVIPGPGGLFYVTRAWVNELFDQAEGRKA